jgi:hypothetical protein
VTILEGYLNSPVNNIYHVRKAVLGYEIFVKDPTYTHLIIDVFVPIEKNMKAWEKKLSSVWFYGINKI